MSADPAARALARFRAVLGSATLVLIALSWPLWVGSDAFPRVPLLGGGGVGAPAWAGRVASLALVACLGAVAVGVEVRRASLGAAASIAALVLDDQHRLQPWAYQAALASLSFATRSAGTSLGLNRLFLVALYFHSGLSKADRPFVEEMGPVLLRGAARPLGLDPLAWPGWLRMTAAGAMPVAEMAVALALVLPRTRRVGRWAAVAMHAALIGTLGPWGLGHSTIVLAWNAAMIAEVLILFAPGLPGGFGVRGPVAWPIRAAFVLAALLPFAERWGYWDAWPSFALYAGHTERVVVIWESWDGVAPPGIPPEAVRTPTVAAAPGVDPHAPGGGRIIDLTAWSLRVRGVPVYPQARAGLGLAEAIAARTGVPRAVKVSLSGRAGAWSGRRPVEILGGLEEIRRRGDRYWLNAHPAGRGWTRPRWAGGGDRSE